MSSENLFSIEKKISELIVREIEASYLRGEFGVIAQDVNLYDPEYLTDQLAALFAKSRKRVRIVLVDQKEAVDRFVTNNPKYAELLSADEETAVAWRNQNLKTIFVVARGQLSKQGSLKEFSVIGEQQLIRRICSEGRDAAEVLSLRTLWDALGSSRGPTFSLRSIASFAHSLAALKPADRSVHAYSLMSNLGLFPDKHLSEESTESRVVKRLKLNADFLAEVCTANPEDRDRMTNYCRSLQGADKKKFNAIRKRIVKVSQFDTKDLTGIELVDAQTLWRGKISQESSSAATLTRSEASGPSKLPVESVVAAQLLDGDANRLNDLADSIHQLSDQILDDQFAGQSTDVVLSEGSTQGSTVTPVVDINISVVSLVKTRSTRSEWGGVIEIDSDKLDALAEIGSFKAWHPFDLEKFQSLLKRFAEAELIPQTVLDLFKVLVDSRQQLLVHLGELVISPVTILAGRSAVLAAAEKYLDCYDQLLKQVEAAYPQMYADAGDEAEELVHWLLSIELYVYIRDHEVSDVLLSPIHPLNLWRSLAIVKDLQALGGKLSDSERETLIAAAAENVQLLNVLVLPRISSFTTSPILLGQAGGIGNLPLFKESPRGVVEPDGIKTVSQLASLIAYLRPFVRPGLQVAFVNAPRPGKFLESILAELDLDNAIDAESFAGVHLRFRYTLSDTKGWGGELDELEDSIKDRIKLGQERGLISVSAKADVIPWTDLVSELRETPSHLTVVFDPFAVRTTLVARAGLHSMSPWMPSCDYRYNKLKKQIVVVPIAEEQVFATYFSAAKLIHRELKQSTATHQPQVSQVLPVLDEIADESTWTVVADPHRVLIPRLSTSEVIDRRIEGGRQLTSFGSDLTPFIRKLDRQLKKTHFIASQATLEELIRDLVAMEPNGILGLVGGEKGKHVKGALGKLIAMRWYRRMEPSGLSVSLDTQNASRWLTAGSSSGVKADLIGLREDEDGIRIDVIEVKAHDESIPYSIEDGVASGHAVDQILATLHALAEVFGGDNSPLAKPRREVLREHLYTALMRDLNPEYIERWNGLLHDLFNGSISVRLTGRLVHVRLASVATSESQIVKSAIGIPLEINTISAADVGLMLSATEIVDEQPTIHKNAGSLSKIEAELEPRIALDILKRRNFELIETNVEDTHSIESEATDEATNETLGFEAAAKGHLNDDQIRPTQLEVLLGEDANTKNQVVWSAGKQSNGFFLVLGSSGSGKTETLKVIGNQISRSGIPVLVLDFHGDVIFPGLDSVLLSSGTSSTIGLNPLELDSQNAEETGLYDQRKVIRDMIRNAVPALRHRQGAILRDAIEEAYRSRGFVDTDPSTWSSTPPTFRDVVQILTTWSNDDSKKTQRSSIEGCIAAVQEIFEHPIFQRDVHVSVDEILSRSIRLDLSRLTDEVRYITAETLLRKIFRVLRLKGPIPVQPQNDFERFRLFVLIDEAKILSTGGGDPDSPDRVLNLLFTEARKFGLGMVLASQMSDHFGSEVTANAATWLVMKPMDVREARKNAPNVQMDPEALTALKGKGDGYFRDRVSPRAKRIQVKALGDA